MFKLRIIRSEERPGLLNVELVGQMLTAWQQKNNYF